MAVWLIIIFFWPVNGAPPLSGVSWKSTRHWMLISLTIMPVGCTLRIMARAFWPVATRFWA